MSKIDEMSKIDDNKREKNLLNFSNNTERNFLAQKNQKGDDENLPVDLNAQNLALNDENLSQNSSQSLFQNVGEFSPKTPPKDDLKGNVEAKSRARREENANKKEKEAQKLARACFDSLNLSEFSEDERAGVLEFFEFRARNTRKSPFSQHTANKIFKQFVKSKAQGTDICAVFDRCIANGWVGYEWGEASVLKEQKYKQWYGANAPNLQSSGANGGANVGGGARVPSWQEIKNAPIGTYKDADGVPLFANKYDEHNFIVKELLKIDEDANFYGWSDEEIAATRILGDKRYMRTNGFYHFVRSQIQNTDKRATENR